MFKTKRGVLLLPFLGAMLLVASCAKKGVICSMGAPEEAQGYQGLIVLGAKDHNKVWSHLCGGDIEKITALITTLDPFQKNRLKALACGPDSSETGFLHFFSALDDEAKADVIRAFATYSYYIHGYG